MDGKPPGHVDGAARDGDALPARSPRNTRAVSALEYAIVVGIAAYETFRSDIREAVTALGRQLSGTN